MRGSLTSAALVLAACSSTGPEQSSLWGAEQASLQVTGSGATLQVLGGQSCYGSFGEINGAITSPSFSLPGTWTQLTGVAPGHVTAPAQFTGSIEQGLLTLSVSIPSTQQTLGPFVLTHGEGRTWPACLYP